MVKILLPLVTELTVILSFLYVCCDINIFFCSRKVTCCLIKTSQSSKCYLKTLLIHENCVSPVKVIGNADGIRWKLCVRECHLFLLHQEETSQQHEKSSQFLKHQVFYIAIVI